MCEAVAGQVGKSSSRTKRRSRNQARPDYVMHHEDFGLVAGANRASMLGQCEPRQSEALMVLKARGVVP